MLNISQLTLYFVNGHLKIFNTEMKFSRKVFQFESIQVKHTNSSDQFVPIDIFTSDENVSSVDLLHKPGSKKANLKKAYQKEL